jgi:hypothetical protein
MLSGIAQPGGTMTSRFMIYSRWWQKFILLQLGNPRLTALPIFSPGLGDSA